MKPLLPVFLLIGLSLNVFSQGDNTKRIRYRVPNSYDSIYVKRMKIDKILPIGTVITKTADKISWQETLDKPDTIMVDKYELIKMEHEWFFDEVEYDDDTKGWVRLNPRQFNTKMEGKKEVFRNEKQETAKHPTQEEMRLKVDPNKFVRLKLGYVSFDALTLPFVFRPGLNDTIGSQLTTDLSLGMSATFNKGWENFRNRRLTTKRSITSFSAGVGLGFKAVDLDASTTSLSDNPITKDQDGLAFFVSPGLGVHTRGITFTLMYGWDLPITENVKEWNYAKKGYLAFGFGLGIDTIGKVLGSD